MTEKEITEECIKIISGLKLEYRSNERFDNSDICKALAIAEARIRKQFFTEDDTFNKLKRRSMLEIHDEWLICDYGYDTDEGRQWFVDRYWTWDEWYADYLQNHPDFSK